MYIEHWNCLYFTGSYLKLVPEEEKAMFSLLKDSLHHAWFSLSQHPVGFGYLIFWLLTSCFCRCCFEETIT